MRTVGVLAGVGHTQEALLGVPYLEVLVLELVTVDRLATGACIVSIHPMFPSRGMIELTITTGKVTTLDHEVLDNTVERGTLIAKALLAGSQSALWCQYIARYQLISKYLVPEVLSGLYHKNGLVHATFRTHSNTSTYLRNSLAIQSKHNTTQWLVTVFDIKVDLSNNNNQHKPLTQYTSHPKTYLAGDLRSPWLLGLFAVDQGHSKREDEEEREKDTPELHDVPDALMTRD